MTGGKCVTIVDERPRSSRITCRENDADMFLFLCGLRGFAWKKVFTPRRKTRKVRNVEKKITAVQIGFIC